MKKPCEHNKGVEVHRGEVYCFTCGKHLGKALSKKEAAILSEGSARAESSVEEEIRKHAIPTWKLCYGDWRLKQLYRKDEDGVWIDWVPLDVVLGVVAKTEAERQKQLTELAKDVVMAFGQFLQGNRGYLSADTTESGAMPYITDYDLQGALEEFFKSKKFEAFLSEGSSQESSQQQEQKQP